VADPATMVTLGDLTSPGCTYGIVWFCLLRHFFYAFKVKRCFGMEYRRWLPCSACFPGLAFPGEFTGIRFSSRHGSSFMSTAFKLDFSGVFTAASLV